MEGFKKQQLIKLLLMVAVLIAMAIPADLFAITNSFEWGFTDFNFSPPGARASGMGGAFVALADDATCAVSNPAGLAQLPRTQIAVEGSYRHYDDTHETKNWYPGTASESTSSTETAVKNNTRLSFASFSTPLFNNSVNVSLFYDKLAYSNSDISYNTGRRQTGYNKVSIDEYGIGVAKGFFEDKLFLGAGLSEANLDLKSSFVFKEYTGSTGMVFTDSQDSFGSSTKMAYRIGLLFVPWDFLRVGLNYSRMPSFNYQLESASCMTKGGNCYNNETILIKRTMDYKIPDTFSAGAAVKPTKDWTIITEAKYVKYSDLLDGFAIAQCIVNSSGKCVNPEDLNGGNYKIPDVWEFHLGTEYILRVDETPIALRTGTYYEPKHSLYANDKTSYYNLYNGGKDIWHWTGGVGTVLYKHWQIDAAVDLAKDKDKVTLSMVYQF
ncbi:MAG: outer membrane protein transport protein [Nitrospirae bacterium]|nr:outer membrane protein transport protein [Nitrospirota bacterium]